MSGSRQQAFLPDAATQPAALDAWVAEVEAAHAIKGTSLPPPEAPDIERLMAAWTPAEEQQLRTSPLPDPHQVRTAFAACFSLSRACLIPIHSRIVLISPPLTGCGRVHFCTSGVQRRRAERRQRS